MQPEVFESSTVSLVLSWILCVPIIIGIISLLLNAFAKHEGVPWIFSAWLGLCVLVFSPARYLLFQVAAATSYIVQSVGAFLSVFLLAIYIPIIFGILYFIGIGLPMLSVMALLKNSERITFLRGLVVSIILPIACIIFSFIFYWVLPFAGKSVGWLSVKDVIKSTNGAPAIIYKYFTYPYSPTILPWYFEDTPQCDIDLLRCHIAATYISDKKVGYFVKYQYPDIYEKATSESVEE